MNPSRSASTDAANKETTMTTPKTTGLKVTGFKITGLKVAASGGTR
jgi:hypothetical protein